MKSIYSVENEKMYNEYLDNIVDNDDTENKKSEVIDSTGYNQQGMINMYNEYLENLLENNDSKKTR